MSLSLHKRIEKLESDAEKMRKQTLEPVRAAGTSPNLYRARLILRAVKLFQMASQPAERVERILKSIERGQDLISKPSSSEYEVDKENPEIMAALKVDRETFGLK